MRPKNYIYNGFRACPEQWPNNLAFSQTRAAKHSWWIDYNNRGVRTTLLRTPRGPQVEPQDFSYTTSLCHCKQNHNWSPSVSPLRGISCPFYDLLDNYQCMGMSSSMSGVSWVYVVSGVRIVLEYRYRSGHHSHIMIIIRVKYQACQVSGDHMSDVR